jgi:prepilin-type N-terminal cleavage/methylation domain-containing protein
MRKARGFTIIELLVVMVIVSLLVAMAAVITRAITSQQRRSLTATRMQGVDAALLQYVMQNRRLPCPAFGNLPATDANYGKESARDDTNGCTTNEQHGIVPWIALGLGENDVADAWERRFTYRVQPVLAGKNGMDMSWCDPAGTGPVTAPGGQVAGACDTTCVNTNLLLCTPPSSFLSGAGNRGLAVQTVGGTPTMTPPGTGAAYVLISHGETGGGGYLNSATLATSTTTDGDEEKKNYANVALRAYYVDDAISDNPGATHFDDIVSRPSVLSVISKAGLGPRQHQ